MTDKNKPTAENDTSKGTEAETVAPKFLALARLRKDVMILGQGTKEEIETLADDATRQGRAAEVFVVAIAGYFSESAHNWDGIDATIGLRSVGKGNAVAPEAAPVGLNPSTGEQPISQAAAAEEGAETEAPTSPQAEQAKAAQDAKPK